VLHRWCFQHYSVCYCYCVHGLFSFYLSGHGWLWRVLSWFAKQLKYRASVALCHAYALWQTLHKCVTSDLLLHCSLQQ
jgi:hypothetical protein